MFIIDYIKSLFGQKNKETENKLAELEKEVNDDVFEHLPKWEDIKPTCGFGHIQKKHILIADDNAGAGMLIEDIIRGIVSNAKYEIKTVYDELAPYRIYKSCEFIDKNICNIDYALLDIVFGGFIVKDGKKFYMDGIDLAAYLKQLQPNIKIMLFTGCYLSDISIERQKIIDKLGKEFLENNILEKKPDEEYYKRILSEFLK